MHIHVEGCLRVISCNSSTEQSSVNVVNHVNIKRGSHRPHIFSSDVMRRFIIKANNGVSASVLRSTQALTFSLQLSGFLSYRNHISCEEIHPRKSGDELEYSLRNSPRVRTNVRGATEYFCMKYSHTMCVGTKQENIGKLHQTKILLVHGVKGQVSYI